MLHMKYCPSCATGLDSSVRACPQCGYVFMATSQSPGNLNADPNTSSSVSHIQPPVYSATNKTMSQTGNSSAVTQPVPKWKRLMPLFIAISVIVTIVQCCTLGLSSGEDSSTESLNSTVESTDPSVAYSNLFVSNYICELPTYWKDDESQKIDTSSLQKHVSKAGDEGTFVRLLYSVSNDTLNSNFQVVLANKSAYAQAIAEGLEATEYTLVKQEEMTFGEAKGLFTVLQAKIVKDDVKYSTLVYSFIFPSTQTQKMIEFGLTVSDNAKYNYFDDFIVTLKSLKKDISTSSTETETSEASGSSITPTTKATPTPVPTDITKTNDKRLAFKRAGTDYSIYYIIDMDEMKAYYFTSNDTKPTVGTIVKGDLKNGLTVNYPYDGGTDIISYSKGNTNKIVVRDQNGFDWNFDICYLSEAEGIMKIK